MIRIVLFLASVGLIALGVVWFADRPGEISVVWLGYRIETSMMVAALALLAVVIVAMTLWSLVMAIIRSPDQVSLFLRHRRAVKGYLAITRGLVAVGSGDARLARRSADDAARLSPGDPLALLLSAQAAQLAGDRAGAEAAFRVMAARDDTKLLGLRGLYIEAQRRNDANAARLYVEEAMQLSTTADWAGQAALDYRCRAGDWTGALAALDAMKSGIDKQVYRRQRAVLLTARALELDESDRDMSRALVLEAVKLAPDLVPAAALAGRRLADSGETRKAGKIIEAAWAAHPHPDLAEAFANVRPGDSARDRRARIKKLAEKSPDHIESALALSRAALDARDFAAARAALSSYVHAPTRRVAALMAEIEESESGDAGRAREWMSRAMRAAPDPAWTADGVVTDQWMPVSPVSGRLDAFEWRVPLAEIGIARAIEPDLPPLAPRPIEARVGPKTGEQEMPSRRSKGRAERTPPKTRAAEPVIPLVHAPDDPGPDSVLESDPVPEPTMPPPDRWQRILQLFR
ncbi:MAG: heme biosynthesis protein HemY [Pseudolabrys sp.]|nr:heme biosynthesis protein HemY [Pseudolabrys sp.]